MPGGSAATKETQKVFTAKSAKHTKVLEINQTSFVIFVSFVARLIFSSITQLKSSGLFQPARFLVRSDCAGMERHTAELECRGAFAA